MSEPFDLLIIGSGPAALTAALYAARAELSVLVLERAKIGGMLPDIAHIANFPGFKGSGQELAQNLRSQVEELGVHIEYAEASQISESKTAAQVLVESDAGNFSASALLLATGSEPRTLPFQPSVPVSYCALCDAPLYKGKNLLVIGGGNSAVGESLMLADLAKQVTIMTHSALKAEPSRIKELKDRPNVTILENTEPTPDNTNGYDAIFVYIGKRPASSLLPATSLDADSYVKTAPDSHRIIGTTRLFAAGDLRADTVKQAIVAAGDGASAAVEIIKFLQGQSC